MSNPLAEELKKYYTKGPKETVFRNGLNATEIATRMQIVLLAAGLEGYDKTRLSKVINGKALFSPDHLEAFCKAAELSNHERRDAEFALFIAQQKKNGWEADQLLPPRDFDVGSEILEHIFRLRSRGYPHPAMELASSLGGWLMQYSSTLRFPAPLHRIRAMALFEITQALRDIVSPAELGKKIEPFINEIRAIGADTKDDELAGLATLAKAGAAHVAGKYGSSTFWLELAMPALETSDYRLEAMRLLLKDWASMRVMGRFEGMEVLARELLEPDRYTRVEQACSTWAGLGHGLGLLGREDRAMGTLEKAAFLCAQIERTQPAPRLRIQIIRGRIATMMNARNPDLRQLKDDVKQGYALARQFRLARYQKLFGEMRR